MTPGGPDAPAAERARAVRLPSRTDGRGILAFIEADRHVPFAIDEVRWARAPFDGRPRNSDRPELVVALRGRVCVLVAPREGGADALCSAGPDEGVLVPAGVERALDAGPGGAVVLVCAGPRSAEPVGGAP